jgi:hypothetical protein
MLTRTKQLMNHNQLFMGAQLGSLDGLIYRGLWEMAERGSGGGASLSMGALWREPRGRASLLGILEDRQKRLWRWSSTSISIGVQLGNLEGGSSTGDSMVGVSLSEEAQCWGPLGRDSLLGTLKDTLSNSLAWVSVSIGAPLLGNMVGRCFHRAFGIKRYIKMPCKQVSLSIGAPLGNLQGICLPGHFG